MLVTLLHACPAGAASRSFFLHLSEFKLVAVVFSFFKYRLSVFKWKFMCALYLLNLYKEGGGFKYSFEPCVKSLSRHFFSLFLFYFPLRQIYVVLKIVKLLDRAWPMLAEAVCRAQSWLQSTRWISGCATDGLYAGCRADNRAKKAENAHSRNYVHT